MTAAILEAFAAFLLLPVVIVGLLVLDEVDQNEMRRQR